MSNQITKEDRIRMNKEEAVVCMPLCMVVIVWPSLFFCFLSWIKEIDLRLWLTNGIVGLMWLWATIMLIRELIQYNRSKEPKPKPPVHPCE